MFSFTSNHVLCEVVKSVILGLIVYFIYFLFFALSPEWISSHGSVLQPVSYPWLYIMAAGFPGSVQEGGPCHRAVLWARVGGIGGSNRSRFRCCCPRCLAFPPSFWRLASLWPLGTRAWASPDASVCLVSVWREATWLCPQPRRQLPPPERRHPLEAQLARRH